MRGAQGCRLYSARYIAAGLQGRGHSLTFVAPHNLNHLVCTDDLQSPSFAPRTWSASRWFDLVSRGAWRLQSRLGGPI